MDERELSCSIRGEIVDQFGRPRADVIVMIASSPNSHHDIAAVTNEQGEFFLGGLTSGSYELHVNDGTKSATVQTTCEPDETTKVKVTIDGDA